MEIFGIESWIGWKRKTSMKKHPDDDANDRGYREHKSVPYYDQVKVISKQERYMKTDSENSPLCLWWSDDYWKYSDVPVG